MNLRASVALRVAHRAHGRHLSSVGCLKWNAFMSVIICSYLGVFSVCVIAAIVEVVCIHI